MARANTRSKEAVQKAIEESIIEIARHLNRLAALCEQEANLSIKAGKVSDAKEHRENGKLIARAEAILDYFDMDVSLAE